jgi:hypothetical protein
MLILPRVCCPMLNTVFVLERRISGSTLKHSLIESHISDSVEMKLNMLSLAYAIHKKPGIGHTHDIYPPITHPPSPKRHNPIPRHASINITHLIKPPSQLTRLRFPIINNNLLINPLLRLPILNPLIRRNPRRIHINIKDPDFTMIAIIAAVAAKACAAGVAHPKAGFVAVFVHAEGAVFVYVVTDVVRWLTKQDKMGFLEGKGLGDLLSTTDEHNTLSDECIPKSRVETRRCDGL